MADVMTPSTRSCIATMAPLLESMDGIAYITDFDGRFLAWGRRHWAHFAAENDALHLLDAESQNSLDCCSGAETADAYRHIYRTLREGKLDTYSFGFRCDSPRLKRELRMSLNTLVVEEERVGIIHQATVMFETERPLMGLFQYGRPAASAKTIIRMCSYCLKIWDQPTWIEAEQYYQQGGSSNVAITHGICPDCHERILAPILNLH